MTILKIIIKVITFLLLIKDIIRVIILVNVCILSIQIYKREEYIIKL